MKKWLETHSVFSVILGAVLIWIAGFLSILAPIPSLYSPFSEVVSLVGLLTSDIVAAFLGGYSPLQRTIARLLASFPLVLLFIAWCFPLFRGRKIVPWRSIILSLIILVLAVVWLAFGWSYGIEYQGLIYTIIMVGYNVIAVCILVLLLRENRNDPSFWSNLTFHTGLFCWIAWCAFPWLGELI